MSFGTPFGGGNTFGAAAKPAFGGTSSPFGSNTLGSSSFQNTAAKPAFGGFGATTTTSSAFGAGAGTGASSPFGASSTQQMNTFGSMGMNTNQFGAAAASSTFNKPAFGASGAMGGGWGSAAANPAATSTGFMAASSAPTAFGSSMSFGAVQPAAAAGGFGAKPAFGSTPFGSTNTTTGGLGMSSGFGVPSATTPFGAASTGFGAPSAPSFGFGSSAAPSQGGTLFGVAAPSAASGSMAFSAGSFGASNPLGQTTGMFGAPTAQPSSAFGAPAVTSGGMFGQAQTHQPAAAPAFGGGSTFGGFGQQPSGIMGGGAGAAGGTGNPPYKASQITDTIKGTAMQLNLHAITAMPHYANKSFEELRLEDYRRGNKTGQQQQSTGGFGVSTSMTSSPFGQMGSTTGASGGLFGSSTAANTVSFGGFGAPAAQTPATPSFGLGQFGAASPASSFSTSGFGAPTQAPAFGAAPALSGFGGFGKPAATGFASLGSSPQPSTTSSFGGFGATPATSGGFGAATSGFGSFGAGKPATTFGTASAPAFGSPAGGGFGGALSGSFGLGTTGGFGAVSAGDPAKQTAVAPTSFGMTGFGATTPTTTGFGGFGTMNAMSFGAPQVTGGFASTNQGFGAIATPQPTQVSMDQKIDFLVKKREEIISESKAKAQISEAPRSFAGFSAGKSPVGMRGTPLAGANLLPRGARRNSDMPPASGSVQSRALLANSTDSLMSPAPKYSGLKGAKTLVVSSTFRSPCNQMDDFLPVPSSSSASLVCHLQTPRRGDDRSCDAATGLTPGLVASTPTLSNHEQRHEISPIADVHDRSLTSVMSPIKEAFSPPQSLCVSAQHSSEGNCAPKLQRSGYFSSPDISVLQKMSSTDLMEVRDFAVFRPNVGKIEWEGPTDVRNLDLDRLVKIEPREVFVYEDGNPPEQGLELNKPAVITLYNVFPKAPHTEEKKKQFLAKLKDFCGKNDAEHLRYDSISGEWVFAVKHFSRYGLDDEDEDDDYVMCDDDRESGLPSEERKSPGHCNIHISVEDDSHSQSPFKRESEGVDRFAGIKRLKTILLRPVAQQEVMFSSNSSGGSPAGHAPRTANMSIMSIANAHVHQHSLDSRPMRVITRTMTRLSPAFLVSNESHVLKAVLTAKTNLAKSRGMCVEVPHSTSKISFTSAARSEPMNCPYVSLGRSFRVGWSRDGRIVHPGKLCSSAVDASFGRDHRFVVERVDCLAWSRRNWSVDPMTSANSIMNALKCASLCAPDDAVAQWTLPSGTSTDLPAYMRFCAMIKHLSASWNSVVLPCDHPDWALHKAILLVDAVVGQEKLCDPSHPQDLMPPLFAENCTPELAGRRREALSRWFSVATHHEVAGNPLDNSAAAGLEHIFNLLTVRQVQAAVEYAEERGLFRLATMLSQIGSDASSAGLLNLQLEQWKNMDALRVIPMELVRIYSLLASRDAMENDKDVSQSTLRGLGWLRGFAALIWYFIDSSTLQPLSPSHALSTFWNWVDAGLIDVPASSFVAQRSRHGANVDYPLVRHGLCNLLTVLLSEQLPVVASVVNALQNEGYSRDELDGRASYLNLVFMECLGMLSLRSFPSHLIRCQIIFQLVSEGFYEWAAFVAMQMPQQRDRSSLLASILQTWVIQAENDETEFEAVAAALDRLLVPRSMLHEALALRCGYLRQYEKQSLHLAKGGHNHEAAQVICRHLAPKYINKADGSHKTLLEMLESLMHQERHRPDGLTALVMEYLQLQDAAVHCKQAAEEVDVVQELKQEATALLCRVQQQMEALCGEKAADADAMRTMLLNMGSYLFGLVAQVDGKLPAPSLALAVVDAMPELPVYGHVLATAVADSRLAFMTCAADCLT